MPGYSNIVEFAAFLFDLLQTDRDSLIGVSGFTGEGKSTFLIKLFKAYEKMKGGTWDFNNMTWNRKELMAFIDGSSKDAGPDGLRPNQLPELSSILVDELFMLFYKRNWYEEGQIDGIGTLNMCRDRHLLMGGNIPNFWDLDGAFTCRIRFYVYIPERGIAWVFEQDNNPFSSDPWNRTANRRIFEKNKHPFNCKNFVCAMPFDDLSPEEKKRYYHIRNTKRVDAILLSKEKKVRYRNIKEQRDNLIKMIFMIHDRLRKESSKKIKKLSCKDISDVIDISAEAVRLIIRE